MPFAPCLRPCSYCGSTAANILGQSPPGGQFSLGDRQRLSPPEVPAGVSPAARLAHARCKHRGEIALRRQRRA